MKITQIDEKFSIYKNNKVVLWGTGMYGTKMMEYFRYFKLDVYAFCDNNSQKWGTIVNGIKVISPKEFEKLYKKEMSVVVQISFHSSVDDDIYKQLNDIGVQYISIYEGLWAFQTHRNIKILEKCSIHNTHDLKAYTDLECNLRKKEMSDYISSYINGALIVCLPPKTADHTLNATFNKYNIEYQNVWHYPEAVDTNMLSSIYPKLKIITAIREPIVHHISLFFQFLTVTKDVGTLYRFSKKIDKHNDVTKKLKELFFKNGGDVQKIFEIYAGENNNEKCKKHFANDFVARFQKHIMDIMAHPFDKEKGYSIIKEDGIEVFVYQLERLNDIIQQLSQWVEVPFEKLENANIGVDKWTGKAYKQAQKEITFSQEYFDACFDEPYVNHFYSEKDIEKFKNRWRSHIK